MSAERQLWTEQLQANARARDALVREAKEIYRRLVSLANFSGFDDLAEKPLDLMLPLVNTAKDLVERAHLARTLAREYRALVDNPPA